MPAWEDYDCLVENPHTDVYLIYYAGRSGLEDRVFRIKTERSSAGTPEPRTLHNISNVEINAQADGIVDLRFNWLTLSYRYRTIDSYFGVSFYTIDAAGYRPLTKAKKVLLKNGYHSSLN